MESNQRLRSRTRVTISSQSMVKSSESRFCSHYYDGQLQQAGDATLLSCSCGCSLARRGSTSASRSHGHLPHSSTRRSPSLNPLRPTGRIPIFPRASRAALRTVGRLTIQPERPDRLRVRDDGRSQRLRIRRRILAACSLLKTLRRCRMGFAGTTPVRRLASMSRTTL